MCAGKIARNMNKFMIFSATPCVSLAGDFLYDEKEEVQQHEKYRKLCLSSEHPGKWEKMLLIDLRGLSTGRNNFMREWAEYKMLCGTDLVGIREVEDEEIFKAWEMSFGKDFKVIEEKCVKNCWWVSWGAKYSMEYWGIFYRFCL